MTNQETLTVESVNEFGIKVGGKQYNYSPKYKGPKLAVGQLVSATVFTSAKGAKYLNEAQVVNSPVPVVASPALSPKEDNTPVSPQKDKRPYKKAEPKADVNWDEVNRGKTASLFVQAILSNPNLSQSLDVVDVDAIQAVVDPLVDYVFGTRKAVTK